VLRNGVFPGEIPVELSGRIHLQNRCYIKLDGPQSGAYNELLRIAIMQTVLIPSYIQGQLLLMVMPVKVKPFDSCQIVV